MVMVPAVALGALVVFGIGYILTSTMLTKSANKTRSVSTLYRGTWREEKRPDAATEKHIDEMSKIGGGIAVVLVLLLLFAVPKEWANIIWIALTVIGILFGLFTFVLQEPKTNMETGTKYKPTTSSRVSLHAKDDLYQNLLAKARNNKDLVDRLIEYERKHMPHASREELIRSAIERWEQDNR